MTASKPLKIKGFYFVFGCREVTRRTECRMGGEGVFGKPNAGQEKIVQKNYGSELVYEDCLSDTARV
jgi:hypothetical protein